MQLVTPKVLMARSAIGREIVGRFNVIFSLFGTSFISCGFSCADSPSHKSIQHKKDRSFCHHINYTMGKNRGRLVRQVLMDDCNQEGRHIKCNTQESIHLAIFNNIHRTHFFLAEEAPICQGRLCRWIGYNSVSWTARAVLDSTFVYPDNCDKATKEIC
jgi:hypothetical protein